ncbi:MAG: COX15/CtaA family protein [Gammaproteobacteria bacterium]|nr:COX15/CtaA family protein [Gammaproteobacteria bacterium]NNF62254.1 COX15/CtaA family protein [Gammaproteobacteria bacterium]NNM21051.1 COX15/CtaA family protein [Gammaproteobacteria bacterium]
MSGAWVRLTDAGLGCPDWPGCYGRLTPPVTAQDIAASNEAFPGAPVDTGKAWREMAHRYAIPLLGLIVISLAAIAITTRRDPLMPFWAPLLLVPLLGLQAILGMLTVTLQLKPIVVLAHLLGGMTTLALLGWMMLLTRPRPPRLLPADSGFRGVALLALLVIFAQVALGGWTSANYAAVACPDFPTCQTQWWPPADFASGFVPWRGLGAAGDADSTARTAIHLGHRLGALVTLLVAGGIALAAALRGRDRATRWSGAAILLLLFGQVALGITIVLKGLPLAGAVAHNGMAALLVLAAVSLNHAAWRQA